MSKAIMISIKPKWVAKILNGEKTIVIRKTCPTIFKHLKSYEGAELDVYIYCTKDREILFEDFGGFYCSCLPSLADESPYNYLNSKVVAKFTLNKVVEYPYINDRYDELIGSCLSEKELLDYSTIKIENGIRFVKTLYAWHISNLVIFVKPKELSEFLQTKNRSLGKCYVPQSWCYIEV